MFPGKVTEIRENEGDVRVNFMRPSGLSGSVWKWPLHKDDIFYKKEHVI